VSVSNACASTPQGLQVFYRDESQGILLAAVKISNGWVYEIVDGDKKSEGRTTGDVAFNLSATTDKNTTYLLYDSVLTINSNRDATSGEVRLAIRKTVFPEDWRYQTIDGPDNGNMVAGYATAIFNNRGRVTAAWLVSRGDSLPNPSSVSFAEVSETNIPYSIEISDFGTPSNPIHMDSKGITFGCQNRLCQAPLTRGNAQLISGRTDFARTAGLIKIKNSRLIAVAQKTKLGLVRL
jgi:hypothetical protein